jgi:hypothetical protein
MGTFAETAIVDYRFLFADQLLFPFPIAANKRKLPFPFSICRKEMEFVVFP